MATVIPFKGIRPSTDKSHLVPSRPIENYNKTEIQTELLHNPFSFLHVINPDFNIPTKTKAGSNERLLKTKAKFHSFIKQNILIQDVNPCYYIYQQNKNGNNYTGIIACSSIDDYLNGTIKIHEQTLTEREEKLKHYLDICEFNAEPILFSYPNDTVINEIISKSTLNLPEYDFKTDDNVHHLLWILNDDGIISRLQEQFSKIKHIYIADGHHRSASSALLGKLHRKNNPNYTGKEPFNFFLGIFFPETELKIFDYNRIIKDLNHLSVEEFISKISEKFIVTKKGIEFYIPIKKHNFSMYIEGNWYSLDVKAEIIKSKNEKELLDSSILSEYILAPILNINDLRNNKRIAFVTGMKGMKELKKDVDTFQYKVAFGLYPVTMQQLKHIADNNKIMPPKTTWIEPKMRSGLVIYSLEENLGNRQNKPL